MGLMDNFSSDGTVTMKHVEYYNLMRETAKCELLTNAVNADVPNCYIKGMITGEKPEIKAILSYLAGINYANECSKKVVQPVKTEPQNKDTIPGLTVEIECKKAKTKNVKQHQKKCIRKNKGDKNVNITN